jgi:hypothetical protein
MTTISSDREKQGEISSIKDAVANTYIVSYQEDIEPLSIALREEGLSPIPVRMEYSAEQEKYASILKCMLTHQECWRRASESEGLALIVEADFVPVVGFGDMKVPYESSADSYLGYLYSCGPQLYDISERGFLRGHAGGLVAYLVDSTVANALLDFTEHLLSSHDPTQYRPFDSEIGFYLAKSGINSYITCKMLGEHGGIPNQEHKSWGLRKTHRADSLANKLHFLPFYAEGSKLKYRWVRGYARLHGIGRLVYCRYLARHDFLRADSKSTMIKHLVKKYFFW